MDSKEQTITRRAVQQVQDFLRNSPWEKQYMKEVDQLRQDIDKPCVLAVAGRVKAGKSSLLNAILGEDLAKVGVTATTATINTFVYTDKDEEEYPILCVYKDETKEPKRVTKEYLAKLQTHEEDLLKLAEEVKEFQYYLKLDFLRDVTLVDTPGTGADVKEHEQAVREYLLQTAQADAILYVVGQVPLETDQKFAQDFQNAFGDQKTTAFNTLGIMARIDQDDRILEQANELAGACASKLKNELSGVVAVSAAIWRRVCLHENIRSPLFGGLEKIRQQLKDHFTEEGLNKLLSGSDSTWKKDREYDGCQMSCEDRIALKDDMPWRVFVVMARELFKAESLQAGIDRLKEISGFPTLLKILKEQFFNRARLLRCHKILSRLLKIVYDEISFRGLNAHRRQIRDDKKKMKSFCDFIASHPASNSESADELRRFLSSHVTQDDSEQQEEQIEILVDSLNEAIEKLIWVNRRFEGLQKLLDYQTKEQAEHSKTQEAEFDELRKLFSPGSESLITDDNYLQYRIDRQNYWRSIIWESKNTEWKQIAELAELCYGYTGE